MDAFAFATFVGLLCNFRQEKGAREALDHQKFVEWLAHHKHEDLKNLIVNQAALRTEVDNLLRSDMTQALHKMDEMSKILLSILGRLDEFKGLAAAAAPRAELSDQAVLILVQFSKSGADTLYHSNFGNGHWSLQLNNDVPIGATEPRFIKDDIIQMAAMDFLDVERNDQ